jgi:hypothetical protein
MTVFGSVGMTRRHFISTPAAAAVPFSAPSLMPIPVHRVMDARAHCTPEQLHHFWSSIWREAVRDFSQGGMELQTSDGPGEVRRSAGDNPIFIGLRRGVINLVLSDHLPLYWDNGRALAGTTTLWDGFAVSMIALSYAHGDRIPYLSVNTCVHELLHALMQDIFVSRPKWYESDGREFRADSYATGLWLFHDGAAIRQSARACLDRLSARP